MIAEITYLWRQLMASRKCESCNCRQPVKFGSIWECISKDAFDSKSEKAFWDNLNIGEKVVVIGIKANGVALGYCKSDQIPRAIQTFDLVMKHFRLVSEHDKEYDHY